MPHKDPVARRAYMAEYNIKNRERLRNQMRQWQHDNAESLRVYRQRHHAKRLANDLAGVRAEQRAAWLARQYGLTPDDYAEMIAAQNNQCAICGDKPPEGKALHIDHDHESSGVRGLLCGHCN